MKSLYIRELRKKNKGQSFDEMFRITEVEPKQNETGYCFVKLKLSDRTGCLSASWSGKTEADILQAYQKPYAMVKGTVDFFNDAKCVKVQRIHSWTDAPECPEDFLPHAALALDTLSERLEAHIASVRSPALRSLLHAIFCAGGLRECFEEAPAAQRRHHACRHGLLQHTIEVTDIAASIADAQASWGYTAISRDLVVAGALLHDIGKIYELSWDKDCIYDATLEGQFLGHTMLGIRTIKGKFKAAPGLTDECQSALLHLVASHHGKLEFGALVTPKLPEALILHMADDLSAKLYYMDEEIEDAEKEFIKAWKFENQLIYGKRISFADHVVKEASQPYITAFTSTTQTEEANTITSLPLLCFTTDAANTEFHTRRLPLVGRAAAGEPTFSEQHIEGEFDVEDAGWRDGEHYLLKVEGDSMTGDGIQNGDMVAVHRQQAIEPDEIAVVYFDDRAEAAIKRVKHTPSGALELASSNPAHAPIPVADPSTLRICGRVVGILRS